MTLNLRQRKEGLAQGESVNVLRPCHGPAAVEARAERIDLKTEKVSALSGGNRVPALMQYGCAAVLAASGI